MCVKHAIRGNDTQNYTCGEMEIISRRVPETAGAPERKGLTLPTRRADSVPTQARGDGNPSGLPSLPVCRMTTKNLILASYVPSVTRRLHKNPACPLPVDCHRYGTEQTLLQAPPSSLGCPGATLPGPKPQQDAKMPISHHFTPCYADCATVGHSTTKGQLWLTQSCLQVPGFRVFLHGCFHCATNSYSAGRRHSKKQQKPLSSQREYTAM